MGLAATQMRLLALTAKKTNAEYQGQQINQQRLNLANQSSSVYTAISNLEVPVPPSPAEASWNAGHWTIAGGADSAATTDYNTAYSYYQQAVAYYDSEMARLEAESANVHQKDKKLELQLKRVDTEHSAIKTELDAIKGILDDNIESSFKTFG